MIELYIILQLNLEAIQKIHFKKIHLTHKFPKNQKKITYFLFLCWIQ